MDYQKILGNRLYSLLYKIDVKISKWFPRTTKFAFMKDDPKYGRYEVGEYSYGKPLIIRGKKCGRLKIGKFCSISSEVKILLSGDHRIDWISTYPFTGLFQDTTISGFPKLRGDTIIGNDVWIGYGAAIMAGVSIGNGAVIAAFSVVTKNVEPFAIVGGNPIRFIRFRFEKHIIDQLQNIAWWDWPEEKIKSNYKSLLTGDINKFISDNPPATSPDHNVASKNTADKEASHP
jgi:virginiamycin A acetyltransferase